MRITVSIELYTAQEMEAFNLFVSKLDERRTKEWHVVHEGTPTAEEALREVPSVSLAQALEELTPVLVYEQDKPVDLYVAESEVDDVTLAKLVRAHMDAKGFAETQKVIAAHGVKRATELAKDKRHLLVKDLQCGSCGGAK